MQKECSIINFAFRVIQKLHITVRFPTVMIGLLVMSNVMKIFYRNHLGGMTQKAIAVIPLSCLNSG